MQRLHRTLQATFPKRFSEKGKLEDKPEFIYKLERQVDEYWTTLLDAMSEGSTVEYNALKGLDIFEFYGKYNLWEAKIKERIKKQKQV